MPCWRPRAYVRLSLPIVLVCQVKVASVASLPLFLGNCRFVFGRQNFDGNGNSLAGTAMLEHLSQRLGRSIF